MSNAREAVARAAAREAAAKEEETRALLLAVSEDDPIATSGEYEQTDCVRRRAPERHSDVDALAFVPSAVRTLGYDSGGGSAKGGNEHHERAQSDPSRGDGNSPKSPSPKSFAPRDASRSRSLSGGGRNDGKKQSRPFETWAGAAGAAKDTPSVEKHEGERVGDKDASGGGAPATAAAAAAAAAAGAVGCRSLSRVLPRSVVRIRVWGLCACRARTGQ